MSDLVTVAVIAGTFQIIAWFVQKLFDRRKTVSESDKSKSESRKIDNDVLGDIVKRSEETSLKLISLNEEHTALHDDFMKISKELMRVSFDLESNKTEVELLKSQIMTIQEENIALRKKNLFLETAVLELKKENMELRKQSDFQRMMIENEKNEGEKLREGIDKLIEQLRSVPLSPIWTPPTETNPR